MTSARTARRRRSARAAGAGIALLLGGTLAAACGGGGASSAAAACTHVNRSLDLFRQSQQTTDQARSTALANQAYVELRVALPLAADAAAADGRWQALMTTLSETSEVPEKELVTALMAQCSATNLAAPGGSPPTTIPPPPPPPPQVTG